MEDYYQQIEFYFPQNSLYFAKLLELGETFQLKIFRIQNNSTLEEKPIFEKKISENSIQFLDNETQTILDVKEGIVVKEQKKLVLYNFSDGKLKESFEFDVGKGQFQIKGKICLIQSVCSCQIFQIDDKKKFTKLYQFKEQNGHLFNNNSFQFSNILDSQDYSEEENVDYGQPSEENNDCVQPGEENNDDGQPGEENGNDESSNFKKSHNEQEQNNDKNESQQQSEQNEQQLNNENQDNGDDQLSRNDESEQKSDQENKNQYTENANIDQDDQSIESFSNASIDDEEQNYKQKQQIDVECQDSFSDDDNYDGLVSNNRVIVHLNNLPKFIHQHDNISTK